MHPRLPTLARRAVMAAGHPDRLARHLAAFLTAAVARHGGERGGELATRLFLAAARRRQTAR